MAIVTAHVAAVQQLYVAYFNRPADVAGLDYWTNVVAAQGSTAAVSATFAASDEYKAAFAGMTNTQIVDKIYQNLFGRAAETAGRDYWVDLLTKGTIKVDTIVAEVAKAAVSTDAEAVENKVAGATAFTAALDTPAEQAGYQGAAALTLAKAFISSITTDASLATATAPTALNASVAAVVAAGTPFTLTSGLAALQAAQDAVADFLAELDLDDDPDTDTTEADVATYLTTTENAVEAEIGGAIDFSDASAAIQAALIADKTTALNTALETATDNLADANEAVEEVDGLAAAIALRTTAEDEATAAADATDEAAVVLGQAVAGFDLRNADVAGADIDVDANGTVALVGVDGIADNGDDVNLIVLNADGELELASGVTETNRPGITAVLEASIAHQAAIADQAAADDSLFAAQLEVHLLDVGTAAEAAAIASLVAEMDEAQVGDIVDGVPTAAQVLLQLEIYEEAAAAEAVPGPAAAQLSAFETELNDLMALNNDANNPLSAAVVTQTTAVETAQENVDDLAEAVAAYEEAQANVEALAALNAAIDAAEDTFVDNNFKAPVTLGATAVGTAGADIFVVGNAAATTISSFGKVGADALYIGTEHTLNTGALADGDNSKLEVFFIQSGTSVKIHLETEVYGSDSAAVTEQIITLTGVDADDLVLNNGIITLKAPTA